MADWLRVAWAAAITLVVLFTGGVGVGFWMLARRTKAGAPRSLSNTRSLSLSKRGPQSQRAAIQLVRADDAVRDARDELDYATAQFGTARTASFARALDAATASVLEAFALQQRLDDSQPDTATQTRDWTARIIHLCEGARASLDAERASFDTLRATERDAPADLTTLTTGIGTLDERRTAASARLAALRSDYTPTALSSVADNLDRATDAVGAARASAATATQQLTADPGSAVAAIRAGEASAREADHLLDSIDELGEQLARAGKELSAQTDALRGAIAEASAVRDNPPDPVTGAAVIAAVARAETTLNALDTADPVAALDRLREVSAELATSLAGARNQQQRLDGARTALAGALVSARSQLSATRNFITARRGRIGGEARTRLAEAERLLVVAEAEADPVAALDTARSAANYARDADALARYDLHR